MVATSGAGGSQAIGPTSGGKVYAFNIIGASPVVVAPKNPQRPSITFHNPGPNVVIVYPQFVQALNQVAVIADVSLSATGVGPNGTLLGGCLIIPANGGWITITGECSGPYMAFALAGTANCLTVMDTNV